MTRPLLLKVWPIYQPHEHHVRLWEKGRVQGPTAVPLNQIRSLGDRLLVLDCHCYSVYWQLVYVTITRLLQCSSFLGYIYHVMFFSKRELSPRKAAFCSGSDGLLRGRAGIRLLRPPHSTSWHCPPEPLPLQPDLLSFLVAAIHLSFLFPPQVPDGQPLSAAFLWRDIKHIGAKSKGLSKLMRKQFI